MDSVDNCDQLSDFKEEFYASHKGYQRLIGCAILALLGILALLYELYLDKSERVPWILFIGIWISSFIQLFYYFWFKQKPLVTINSWVIVISYMPFAKLILKKKDITHWAESRKWGCVIYLKNGKGAKISLGGFSDDDRSRLRRVLNDYCKSES